MGVGEEGERRKRTLLGLERSFLTRSESAKDDCVYDHRQWSLVCVR